MTTNFFQHIASLNIPGNWKISIHTEDNTTFTISALFTALQCGDDAAKAIPPMLLTGTTEELDNGFFDTIKEPAIQTAGLYTNMEIYLKGLEQAKLASKQEQDRKTAEKKQATTTPAASVSNVSPSAPKPSREELNKAFDAEMEKVTDLIKKLKFTDALNILPSVDTYPHKDREITKKRDYLKQQAKFYEATLITFNQENQ